MLNKRIVSLLVIAAIFAMAIPFAAAAADAPGGCVTCHTGDKAIPTVLTKVKGHPNVTKLIKSVPDGCAMCHKAGAPKAPTLVVAIHSVHKVAKGVKAADIKGDCLTCHSTDGKVKKAPSNW
ncbi:MAG: hypothetical protein ACOYM2_00645 [Rectinemataceae bacterium]